MMNLQEALKPFGINNYNDLARRTGISHSYAHLLWSGTRPLTLGIAKILQREFGFTLDEILGSNDKAEKA